ncbi:MAG TPA: hypothetical protein VKB69_08920 [Micromonosporaceae bacterium]|nr:hypothetical protein [Micromonosporaceae bacterium]
MRAYVPAVLAFLPLALVAGCGAGPATPGVPGTAAATASGPAARHYAGVPAVPAAGSAVTITDGVCLYHGRSVPCHDPVLGWYNPADDCYWNRLAPQPPPGDPRWGAHAPGGGGRLYGVTCETPYGPGAGAGAVSVRFAATRPLGYDPRPTAAQAIAVKAVLRLPLDAGTIHTAPAATPGTPGLVGLPTWLWTDLAPATWGPTTATVPVSGLRLAATWKALRVDWYMGDGTTVVCTSRGTPYPEGAGNTSAPDCGYRYARAGTYTVSATTWFVVTLTVLGVDVTAYAVRASTRTLTIDELQVVTQ